MGQLPINSIYSQDLVSIIIPAYNAERHIFACIKSVLKQTYSHIELIIVNDGSFDRTSRICQEFAAKDSRIIFINKEKNEGVDHARYDGVQQASGSWIAFVDADDILMPEAISSLHGAAAKYDVDMVMGNSRISALFGLMKRNCLLSNDLVGCTFGHEDLMRRFYISFFGVNILSVTMWGKLYKTEIVRQSYQPTDLKFGEDLLFNMRLFPLLRSAYFISDIVYSYRQASGITSRLMPFWIDNVKRLYREKQHEMRCHNLTEQADFYAKVELINCLLTYVDQFLTFKPSTRKENIAVLSKELEDPIYHDISKVPYKHSEVSEAIANKDAANLYAFVENRRKQAPLRTKAKYLIRRILRRVL